MCQSREFLTMVVKTCSLVIAGAISKLVVPFAALEAGNLRTAWGNLAEQIQERA